MAPVVSVGLDALAGLIVGLVIIVWGIVKFGKSLDKLWSVTHIQTILWTGVILGSYLSLSLASGGFLNNIPTNTLVLVGITSGTLASTSITKGVMNNGKASTSEDDDPDPNNALMGGFLASEADPSQASLVKAQMFAWNIIAILLFVTFVGSNLHNGNYALPDVGATLATILGISNGAHVAVKPTEKPKKKPTKKTPPVAPAAVAAKIPS